MAISRTEVCTGTAPRPTREIRQLFIDAIHAAERIIYIENQYCSSDALFHALVRRMRQRHRPRLQIVLVIAEDAEAFLEQFSIGIAQSRIIRELKKVAKKTGHSFGIYYPASTAPGGEELATYIHSKLLLVDDRLLSVGSANMNNRSMGYDTELNVAWDDLPESALSHALRNVRIDLLAEHTGLEGEARERLAVTDGLVDYLNSLADSRQGRLRHHPMRSVSEEYRWLTTFLPNGLPFDSEIALERTQQKDGGESWLARGWAYLTGAACRSRSTATAPMAAARLREEKTL
jgi:phosphatidylserine/phosphatidylglycerophosphate/cardiolipin synthase-like enzyme